MPSSEPTSGLSAKQTFASSSPSQVNEDISMFEHEQPNFDEPSVSEANASFFGIGSPNRKTCTSPTKIPSPSRQSPTARLHLRNSRNNNGQTGRSRSPSPPSIERQRGSTGSAMLSTSGGKTRNPFLDFQKKQEQLRQESQRIELERQSVSTGRKGTPVGTAQSFLNDIERDVLRMSQQFTEKGQADEYQFVGDVSQSQNISFDFQGDLDGLENSMASFGMGHADINLSAIGEGGYENLGNQGHWTFGASFEMGSPNKDAGGLADVDGQFEAELLQGGRDGMKTGDDDVFDMAGLLGKIEEAGGKDGSEQHIEMSGFTDTNPAEQWNVAESPRQDDGTRWLSPPNQSEHGKLASADPFCNDNTQKTHKTLASARPPSLERVSSISSFKTAHSQPFLSDSTPQPSSEASSLLKKQTDQDPRLNLPISQGPSQLDLSLRSIRSGFSVSEINMTFDTMHEGATSISELATTPVMELSRVDSGEVVAKAVSTKSLSPEHLAVANEEENSEKREDVSKEHIPIVGIPILNQEQESPVKESLVYIEEETQTDGHNSFASWMASKESNHGGEVASSRDIEQVNVDEEVDGGVAVQSSIIISIQTDNANILAIDNDQPDESTQQQEQRSSKIQSHYGNSSLSSSVGIDADKRQRHNSLSFSIGSASPKSTSGFVIPLQGSQHGSSTSVIISVQTNNAAAVGKVSSKPPIGSASTSPVKKIMVKPPTTPLFSQGKTMVKSCSSPYLSEYGVRKENENDEFPSPMKGGTAMSGLKTPGSVENKQRTKSTQPLTEQSPAASAIVPISSSTPVSVSTPATKELAAATEIFTPLQAPTTTTPHPAVDSQFGTPFTNTPGTMGALDGRLILDESFPDRASSLSTLATPSHLNLEALGVTGTPLSAGGTEMMARRLMAMSGKSASTGSLFVKSPLLKGLEDGHHQFSNSPLQDKMKLAVFDSTLTLKDEEEGSKKVEEAPKQEKHGTSFWQDMMAQAEHKSFSTTFSKLQRARSEDIQHSSSSLAPDSSKLDPSKANSIMQHPQQANTSGNLLSSHSFLHGPSLLHANKSGSFSLFEPSDTLKALMEDARKEQVDMWTRVGKVEGVLEAMRAMGGGVTC
ncbi:hypothetical protein HDV05_001536 [Chytridiales sp. JEL 0842]|nr:hypothetical protein HDV05_001536 [Chytridiales sp. JEL 0842]